MGGLKNVTWSICADTGTVKYITNMIRVYFFIVAISDSYWSSKM